MCANFSTSCDRPAWSAIPTDAVGLSSPVRFVRRAWALGWRDSLDVAVAQISLLRARRALASRPRGELLRAVPAGADGGLPSEPLERLERMAVAVRRASDHGVFRPTCLVRALALEALARRAGSRTAVVRVGVSRDEGRFAAHAWLEVGGRIVGDTPENVGRYTVLDDFSGFPV